VNLPSLSTFGFGALLTALVAGWEQAKSMFGRVLGFLIVTVEFDGGYAGGGARIYAREKLRPTWTAFWSYTGRMKFVRPWKKHACVMFEQLGDHGRLYWKGRLPVWISMKKGKEDDSTPVFNRVVVFRFLRGTYRPDELAQEVASLAGGLLVTGESRFRVVRLHGASGKLTKSDGPAAISKNDSSQDNTEEWNRLVGWRREDINEQKPDHVDPVERLALTEETSNVVESVRRWFKSKEWYSQRQIPWRFGVLFHGKPGTGKSSLTKALAQSLDMPLVVMDISTMDNQEFHSNYQTALGYTPAVVLIEDIDAVFHGRENVAAEKGKGLTYDCFLNTISGVEKSDGILLVVTTNNLDQIDPALGVPQAGATCSRPGRIDRVVELPALTESGRWKVARRILAGCHESWVEHLVRIGANDTGAQFEDRCATRALSVYWSADPAAPAPRG
jgi:hypothetical protein